MQQENNSYVGPAVLLSGTLKSLGAGPTGPLEKIAKIRADHNENGRERCLWMNVIYSAMNTKDTNFLLKISMLKIEVSISITNNGNC